MDGEEEEAELGNPKMIRTTPKACSGATPPNYGNLLSNLVASAFVILPTTINTGIETAMFILSTFTYCF